MSNPKIIVHGRATSSNVQVVMWTLAELGLECERRDVGGAFGGTDTPEYRAMNPNGLVPAFQDGGLTMFESPAIVRYLGAEYGDDAFWPRDNRVRAELDVWAEWSKGTVSKAVIYEVFWTLVRTPKAKRNMEAFAVAVEGAKGIMAMADKRIGDGPYLGGENLTFADAMLGHMLYRYFTLDFDRADLPNLKAYYDRLTARPAYQEHVMVDYSVLQVD